MDEAPYCETCGYCLRGLPRPVCPECGTSFKIPAQSSPRRFWAKAPPLWHVALSVILAAILLYVISDVPVHTLHKTAGSCMVFPVIVVLLFDYLFRAAIARRRSTHSCQSRDRIVTVASLKWMTTPLLVVLVTSAVVFDWPLRLRFALSRGAFKRAVDTYASGQPVASCPGLLGFYHVRRVYEIEPGTLFFEVGPDFTDIVGFVYRGRTSTTGRAHRYVGYGWYLEWW